MLAPDEEQLLGGIGGMLLTFAFAPALLVALIRRRSRAQPRWLLNIAVTVLVSWCVINTYRVFIELPTDIAYAQSEGDFESDGVGANVANLLFIGWFFPLVECAGVWAIAAALSWKAKRSKLPPGDSAAVRGAF